MRNQWLLIVTLVALLLVACGPATTQDPDADQEAPVASPTSAEGDPQGAIPQSGEEAPAEAPAGPPASFAELDYTTTDSGLQIAVTEEGSGEQAVAGKVVSVHYTGMLGDGTVFGSSLTSNQPIRFPLGQGRVIPGWDEAIALLSEGAKAKLIVPPELGYGAQGSQGGIPPNATLFFEVELLEVLEGGPDAPEEVDAADYEETESGLQYVELTGGDGVMPEVGEPVRLHYTAWLEDGTRIDSSVDAGSPVTFELGSEQVFAGWNEVVQLMDVGDKWQVIIPSELALGEEGAAGVIPPDSNLIMQLELLEVLPSGPAEPTDVEEDAYTTTESGVRYVDLEEGEGDALAEGDTAALHYTGWLEDGTKFDSSFSRGRPLSMIVGSGQVIPGWDEGVLGMKPGGRRQLVIPPELAYGEEGVDGVIPPDATLIFEIELQEVTPAPR